MNKLIKSIEWEVSASPVMVKDQAIKGYKALLRSDNDKILSITKDSYYPIKNEIMIETVDKLQNVTGFKLEGYSEFKEGRVVLAYLKNEEKLRIDGWDFNDYMVVGNSHDKTSGFFVGSTTEMIRCMNQFSRIAQSKKVFHTKNHQVKIDQILMYFEEYMRTKAQFNDKMEKWSKIEISQEIREALINRVLRIDGDKEEISARKANLVAELTKSIDREVGDIGNNLFGLFNGVTHYTTHVRKTNEKVFGNVLGTHARINSNAFAFCEEVAR
jgi:hypothetical protein